MAGILFILGLTIGSKVRNVACKLNSKSYASKLLIHKHYSTCNNLQTIFIYDLIIHITLCHASCNT